MRVSPLVEEVWRRPGPSLRGGERIVESSSPGRMRCGNDKAVVDGASGISVSYGIFGRAL